MVMKKLISLKCLEDHSSIGPVYKENFLLIFLPGLLCLEIFFLLKKILGVPLYVVWGFPLMITFGIFFFAWWIKKKTRAVNNPYFFHLWLSFRLRKRRRIYFKKPYLFQKTL